jgi:TetR/AcrR family transcriptional repressor of nem operon
MNEIWRSGFEPLSVKAISEKLGITRSSFYNSFESREALFIEALERYFDISPNKDLTQFEKSPSPLRLLTKVFRATCYARTTDSEHRGCLFVNTVSELVGVNETLGPVIENAAMRSIKCFERLLDQSVSLGELPKNTNTENLAIAVQNALMGLNTLSKIVKNEKQLWLAVRTTLDALKVYKR